MPSCMTADQPSNGYADPQWDRGRLAAEAQSREGVGTDATRAREGRASCGCGRLTSNASRSLCLCPAALCASAANLPLEGEGGSERDVVFAAAGGGALGEVVVRGVGRHVAAAAAGRARSFATGRAARARSAGAVAAATAREDDVVGDDLGRVALLAVFLVTRGLEATFDQDRIALRQDLAERLGAATPHRHAMPLRALLADVVAIEVALVRRQAQLEDGLTPGGHSELGVCTQISEQHHTVQPFGHRRDSFGAIPFTRDYAGPRGNASLGGFSSTSRLPHRPAPGRGCVETFMLASGAVGLDDHRKRIDDLDDQILKLLDERAGVVADVALAKREANLPRFDPERERQVLDRLAARAGQFPPDAVRAVYREVMSASLALQEPIKVAYLGPEGTFSHAAARQFFGLAVTYSEATTFDGVFDAVSRRQALYGVVPVENSSEGTVPHAVDALVSGDLLVRAEFEIEVSQCLLGRASGLASVERVYSKAEVLGQCRVWLAKNLGGAQLVQASSTAAAVREALTDPQGAAIASRLASELYGLPVMRERVQDRAENYTRFVVVAHEDAGRTGDDKTTVAFSLRDGRGAL